MTILATVIDRLTFILNQNNTSGNLIRPTFKSIVETFIRYEKIDKEMINFWKNISKKMTTKNKTMLKLSKN